MASVALEVLIRYQSWMMGMKGGSRAQACEQAQAFLLDPRSWLTVGLEESTWALELTCSGWSGLQGRSVRVFACFCSPLSFCHPPSVLLRLLWFCWT